MGLFFFFIVFIGVSISGSVVYLIYLPFKLHLQRTGKLNERFSRKIDHIFFSILIIAIVTITYIGLYPDENFYEEEFKKVTLQNLPSSAKFISKASSYPDFHGDYCSSSVIELSRDDYMKLYESVSKNPLMHGVEENYGFDEKLKPNARLLKGFERTDDEHFDFLIIEFYSDSKTIVINRCVY